VQEVRAFLVAALVAGVCGCAPSDLRRHFDVTIATEPAGAACLLTGGAEPVGAVPAAPAVVRLEQAPRDVRVFCTLAGHAPVVAVLPVGPDRGKLVSAAVVAAVAGPMYAEPVLGGAHRYPSRLDVALLPVRFATADERDRFFANRMDESRLHFDQPIRALKSMCRADEFGCQHTIAEMGRARDEELARLEELRKATPAPQ
jgi:hypothetical protein